MNKSTRLAVSLSLAALCGIAQTARADSREAMCEFYKNGDQKDNRSGPCTISQRQGYIDIDLRNGDTYSLSPVNKADHYKDQKGDKVVRSGQGGNKEKYQWDHKKVIVTFSDTSTSQHNPQHHSTGNVGDTPHNLRDLVGARAGQAEGDLKSRGYEYRNGSKSGGASYTNWRERSSGRCVTIRTEQGRYQSIIYSTDFDCNS